MTKGQAELGTDVELLNLVAKIRGFDFANATMTENHALTQALKLIAEDTTRRWDAVRQMQADLREKLAAASVAAELADVVNAMREPAPARRGLFR